MQLRFFSFELAISQNVKSQSLLFTLCNLDMDVPGVNSNNFLLDAFTLKSNLAKMFSFDKPEAIVG